MKAIGRGINVLTEKPVSLRRADVRRVYGVAREKGVRVMVAQVLRFWPEYEPGEGSGGIAASTADCSAAA